MTRRALLLSLALLGGAAPGALAQAGTAPIVLRVPAGARSMALGDAYTAGWGAEMLFYNPARIIVQPGEMISLGAWGSGARMGTFGTTLPVAGNFTAGFGARYLEFYAPRSGVAEPGDLTLPTGAPSSSLAATFGLAHTLLGLQLGGAVTYVHEEGTGNLAVFGGGFTWSVGLTHTVGSFGVALAAEDLGKQVNTASGAHDTPERLSLGVTSQSIPVGEFIDITPIVQVSVNRAHDVRPAGGINFAYTPVEGFEFAARVGLRWVDSTTAQRPSPFSFGLGFTLDRLSIEYAFEPYSGGNGAEHRIGLRAR